VDLEQKDQSLPVELIGLRRASSLVSSFAAAHFHNRSRSGIEISADHVAPFLGIELRGNSCRIHEIAERHRDMPALANSFRDGVAAAVDGGGDRDAGGGAFESARRVAIEPSS
jgi:hypothetical protein